MKYKAIIFDLFGTLVGDLIGPPYTDILKRIATTLSIPSDDFIQAWSDTSYERNTGSFRSVRANIVYICNELEVQPSDADISLSARIRHDYKKQVMMKPRSGAVETLSRLKQLDTKIGLISNCTPDAPAIWPDTLFRPLFDVVVFSSSSGCKKPEYQIYKHAIDQLNVTPEHCLYVGNGQSGELRGAHEAGMYPVLITPDTNKGFQYVPPEEEEIALTQKEGKVISSLEEVLIG